MLTVSVDEVRSLFSAALRDVPTARGAWVSSDDDTYHLWLLIEPSDMAQERKLYALVDPLYDSFPSTGFMLHVLNPSTYDSLAPERVVPRSALHIWGSTAA